MAWSLGGVVGVGSVEDGSQVELGFPLPLPGSVSGLGEGGFRSGAGEELVVGLPVFFVRRCGSSTRGFVVGRIHMVSRALVPYVLALASAEGTRAEVFAVVTVDSPVAQGRAELHPGCFPFFPASPAR